MAKRNLKANATKQSAPVTTSPAQQPIVQFNLMGVQPTEELPAFVREALEQMAASIPELSIRKQPLQVHMVGKPIIQLPPGTQSTNVPDAWRSHPLIEDSCFYTLPLVLLKAIEIDVNPVSSENELWPLESTASEICGDHTMQVGFVDGSPLLFPLLRIRKTLGITLDDANLLGWEGFNEAKLATVERTYQKLSKWYNTIARGYAGWLNCNPTFRKERDDAMSGRLTTISLTDDLSADCSGDKLPSNVQEFLARWRLMGMAGPKLPIPMRPMLSGNFPMSIIGQLMDAGGLFNLPDTFPIPSRDELRELLESSVRTEKPVHLEEWTQMTGKGNPAKNKKTSVSLGYLSSITIGKCYMNVMGVDSIVI